MNTFATWIKKLDNNQLLMAAGPYKTDYLLTYRRIILYVDMSNGVDYRTAKEVVDEELNTLFTMVNFFGKDSDAAANDFAKRITDMLSGSNNE